MYKLFVVLLLVSLSVLNLNPYPGVIQEVPLEQAERYLKELSKNYAEGDYDLHKAYSDSLLYISREHNLTKMQILGLTNQAVFYKNRSERLKAIELFHDALEKCEQIPDDFRAKIVVLVNMGNIYNDIGSYDKAIEYMENVLELLDANENSDKIRAAALIGLANNYAASKNYEKTVFYSEKAKALGEKLDNEDIIVSAINNISDAYIISKKYSKALKINQSISHLELLNKPTKKRASFLLNNGIANYRLNNLDVSLENLKACQKLSKEKQILETQMYAHEFLAKVYEQRKDYKASFKEQKAYTLIRNLFLKDKKDASNADLNEEINSKNERIIERDEAFKAVSKSNTRIIILVGVLILLSLGLLGFYMNRKKKLELQQIKLRSQYRALQQDLKAYKSESLAAIKTDEVSKKNNLKPYKNSSLTEDKRVVFKQNILTYMADEKPFLNPDMTQLDLANQLGMSSHHFSEVLYYNMEQNFYNFINSYRILEAQNLMKDSKYNAETIITIAFDSGFKSKSSFNRIFKNHTGITPSEYRNQIVS